MVTMCGEVTGEESKKHFDPESRCLVYEGKDGPFASRYIGLAEDILDEIREAGFHILHWEVKPRRLDVYPNDQDDLLVDATIP